MAKVGFLVVECVTERSVTFLDAVHRYHPSPRLIEALIDDNLLYMNLNSNSTCTMQLSCKDMHGSHVPECRSLSLSLELTHTLVVVHSTPRTRDKTLCISDLICELENL